MLLHDGVGALLEAFDMFSGMEWDLAGHGTIMARPDKQRFVAGLKLKEDLGCVGCAFPAPSL